MSALAPIEQVAPNDGKDPKAAADAFEDVEGFQKAVSTRALEAPPAIRAMTADERKAKEKAMVRKIDLRLLPPVIIM
jgi:hypothetical protein